jgi:hypothetical protein
MGEAVVLTENPPELKSCGLTDVVHRENVVAANVEPRRKGMQPATHLSGLRAGMGSLVPPPASPPLPPVDERLVMPETRHEIHDGRVMYV